MDDKELFFEVLTQEEAIEIAYNWKFEGDFSFFNMTSDEEELHDFLDADMRGQNTFSVRTPREKEMVAYFNYDLVDNSTAEIVLGINPTYIDKEYGQEIILYVEKALHDKKGVQNITVAVAQFNKLCAQFYLELGFTNVGEFYNNTNGGIHSFLKMEKNLTTKIPSSF